MWLNWTEWDHPSPYSLQVYTEELFSNNANNERGLCTVLDNDTVFKSKIFFTSIRVSYIAEHENNIAMNIVAIYTSIQVQINFDNLEWSLA